MRVASAGLINILNLQTEYLLADLLTIVPKSGSVVRLTSSDHDITVASRYPNPTSPATQTFPCSGPPSAPTLPTFKRGATKLVVGVEVDTIDIELYATPPVLYAGAPWPSAARVGAFDEADIVIEKLVCTDWADTSAGTLIIFWGRVAEVRPRRNGVTLTVNSYLDLLTLQPLPRNAYQPGCLHTLFDTGCAISKGAFAVSGTVAASPAPSVNGFATNLTNPNGYFDLGTISFTSGVLSGQSRTIKGYLNAAGALVLLTPLTAAPAAGDTFTAYPGCDKSQATCTSKFSNLAHFRGFPYVPQPEAAR